MLTCVSENEDDEVGDCKKDKDVRTNVNSLNIAYKIRTVPSVQVLPKNSKFMQP